jgi:hypothetical protein
MTLRQVNQTLDGLLIPDLRNIVSKFLPVARINIEGKLIKRLRERFGDIVIFSSQRNVCDVKAVPLHRREEGITAMAFASKFDNNPPFRIQMDLWQLTIRDHTLLTFTIEFDPDLNVIYRITATN